MGRGGSDRGPAAPWLREAKRTDSSGLSIDKMPLLGGALDQFAAGLGPALAGFCGEGISGAVDGIEATTTFEALGAYQGHLAAVLRCASLDVRLLMILDARIVDFVLRTIFEVGPLMEEPSAAQAERAPTDIERSLVAEFAKTLTRTLQDVFGPLTGLEIEFERVEELDDPQLLGPKDAQAIGAKVMVKAPAGVCVVILVMPRGFVGPVSQKFAKGAAGGAKADPKWSRELEHGVTQARVTLTAVLDEFDMSLGALSSLAVGQVIELSGDGRGAIRIECAERGVFHCKLGEQNDRYALEIEDIIARDSGAAASAGAS
jgi:flagellar motor switch protein FliM